MHRIKVTAIDATKRRQPNERGAMMGEKRKADLRHSNAGLQQTPIVDEALQNSKGNTPPE
jgi:hypothetical protein